MKYFNVYFVDPGEYIDHYAVMESEASDLVSDINSWSSDGSFSFDTVSINEESNQYKTTEEWAQNVATKVEAKKTVNPSDIIIAPYNYFDWGYGSHHPVNTDSGTFVDVATVYGNYFIPGVEATLMVRHETGHIFSAIDDEPYLDHEHGMASADFDSSGNTLDNVTPMACAYCQDSDGDSYMMYAASGPYYPDDFIYGTNNYQGDATAGVHDGVFVFDYSAHMQDEIDRWVNRYAN